MKRLFLASVLACFTALALPVAHAQQFPTKPIRLIIPYPPGGATDAIARAVADRIRITLGQPVIVDYRPGAGTAVGSDYVAKSPPDGYTLLLAGSSMTTLPAVAKVNYDAVKSFEPVSLVMEGPVILVVRPEVPAKNVAELVAYMKANPGKMNFGNAGAGAITHFIAEEFRALAGVDFLHVPYKGAAAVVADLLGGRVQAAFDVPATMGPHVASGALRLLAVQMRRRVPQFPDVPTMAEAGYPIQGIAWAGVFAPAGTPKPIVARLNAAVAEAMADAGVQTRIRAIGGEPFSSTPEILHDRVARELERWPRFAKEMGIKIE